MAEATFSLAVENLGILLIQMWDILPLHIQREARELRDELERRKFFWSYFAKRQPNGLAWISQLRKVAQDAEDFIRTGIYVQYPAEEINSLRERLREINEIDERNSRGVERQVTPWHIVEHVVGLEQEVELLLNSVIFPGRNVLSVAAIVGLGGIGKTTFARLVYNDVRVTRQYHRIWICVSSESSLADIIKKLLLQLLRQDEDELHMLQLLNMMPLRELIQLLQLRLTGKRYLIVLDDVQDIPYLPITCVLPDEGNGSRLLITSCNRNFKNHAQWFHEMTILDLNNSWKLLFVTYQRRRKNKKMGHGP